MHKDSWRCNNDEHINRKDEIYCEICGEKRPIIKSFNYVLTDVYGSIKVLWESENTNRITLSRKGKKSNLLFTLKEVLIENVKNKEEITLLLSNDITTYSESLKIYLDKPEIVSFQADKSTILESKPINLSWEIKNATTVSITGIGKVAVKGNILKKAPKVPFKITAENEIGKIDKILDLKIIPFPVISEYRAKQQKIELGKETQLVWNIKNVTNVELHYLQNIYIISNKGEKNISPTEHTEYKLILTALDGITKIEKKITVQVYEKVVIYSFSSDLILVKEGLPIKLNWSVKNANKIMLIDNLGRDTNVTHKDNLEIIANRDLRYFKLIASDPLNNKVEENIDIKVKKSYLNQFQLI